MADFTAHNILLPDGTRTAPHLNWLITDSPWLTAAQRVVNMLFPYGAAGRSVVDLGCLEGGYTVGFAKMRMRALGIEVRQSNIEKCRLVQRAFPDLPLSFVKDDVWNVANYGRFDVAFCCGLLYHLDRPIEFLRTLNDVVSHAIILNTHVSDSGTELPSLSPMCRHEGVPGRWYREYDPAQMTVDALERASWTSWSNEQSFWPTRTALFQALTELGFDLVFEQADWLGPDIPSAMADPLYAEKGRRMIVGIRTGQGRRGLLASLHARLRNRMTPPRPWRGRQGVA